MRYILPDEISKERKKYNEKKPTMPEQIKPIITLIDSVAISASGPWGDEEREFIYPTTVGSATVTASLAYELGTKFKPNVKKQIIESIEHHKIYLSEFEVGIKSEGIFLKIKRKPKKTTKIFTETGE
jgi:hypothetical protein